MPELATDDYVSVPVPRKLKVSSKRQITIPVDVYERHGFAEYALLTETEEGFTIQPLKVDDGDEGLTVMLLRYLVECGYEGDALIEKYQEMKPSFFDFHKAIRRSEADIAAGRVADFGEMMQELQGKYGL